MDKYNELKSEKERADRLLLTAETVLGYISTITFIAFIFLASYIEMPDSIRILLIVGGIVILTAGVSFALKIEQIAGYYECGKCHHKYIPSYFSLYFASHIGRTRYMKCPECGKKSWSKKVLRKD